MTIETEMEWVKNRRRATPVLYLDLDDTVRKGFGATGKWVNGPEDVEVFPEVPGILQVYKDGGWRSRLSVLQRAEAETAALRVLQTTRWRGKAMRSEIERDSHL